jgi:hypothetical protein
MYKTNQKLLIEIMDLDLAIYVQYNQAGSQNYFHMLIVTN